MAFPYAEPETFAYVKPRIDADPRLQLSFIRPMMDQMGGLMEKSRCGRPGVHLRQRLLAGLAKTAPHGPRAQSPRSTASPSQRPDQLPPGGRQLDKNLCYELLGAVNTFFGPYLDNDRFDDFIAFPQNGYRAIQVTAWLPDYGAIEVAIATREMEGENMWGVVDCIKNRRDTSCIQPGRNPHPQRRRALPARRLHRPGCGRFHPAGIPAR